MKRISGYPGTALNVEQYYLNRRQINLMNSTTKQIITECSKCGQRFKNWTYATPCCSGLSVIVENDKKTTKVFLSTLIKPINKNYHEKS